MDVHAYYDLPRPQQTYFICSIQRSGSGWLSNALTQTGIAGQPVEHFNIRPIEERRKVYGLKDDDFIGILRVALQLSMTSNGVCSIKFMYQQMTWLVDNLRILTGDQQTPECELLERFFPHLQFIYTYRRDKLSQGISAHKALQSKVYQWYASPEAPDYALGSKWHFSTEKPDVADRVAFNVIELDLLIEHGILHSEINWQRFFKRNHLNPLTISYEDFAENYEGTLKAILAYLSLPWPDTEPLPPALIQRISDEINTDWRTRYMAQKGWLADDNLRTEVNAGEYSGALLIRLMHERGRLRHIISVRENEIANLQAEAQHQTETHHQQLHTPAWVRDHIPWRVLVAALLEKGRKWIFRK